ncbi:MULTISPECIES: glycosyltransferase family 8 protein [Rodentibacter]|uniref:Glycosyl transferase n=2 Tax=Rodentibacter TaxID=1960084 RepID=A0A1V3IPZ0_9PAST|nr:MULTISPECIES: glycosyltransferase family 8 protein [Rodentibacter]OOF43969.1 glycosyl transferase [Rodentibacter rarus]OOF45487.1 glycosyl transferase [Rodentibacter trehalosifermentans]OOF48557.1 glycosyl transferase [Rodentibacter trehalosifermentans]OOF48950.1 glycosyl transferase [Rodentibacter trehalosifermentans]
MVDKNTIVFAADSRFSEQLMTAIKSICYHNKDIRFFILNRELSSEWFSHIRAFLEKINCEIFDIKIEYNELKKYSTLPHISSDSTYFRYFIPEFIDSDRVLYLDCDVIVNGSLNSMFEIELGGYFLAASLDNLAHDFHNQDNAFNAGVLIINNQLWKKYDTHQELLRLTEQYGHKISDSDQGILNLLFEGKWVKLTHNANYLVGAEYIYIKNNLTQLILRPENELPLILHFNTEFKPWLPIYDLPFRDIYWFYYSLPWQDIITKHQEG